MQLAPGCVVRPGSKATFEHQSISSGVHH